MRDCARLLYALQQQASRLCLARAYSQNPQRLQIFGHVRNDSFHFNRLLRQNRCSSCGSSTSLSNALVNVLGRVCHTAQEHTFSCSAREKKSKICTKGWSTSFRYTGDSWLWKRYTAEARAWRAMTLLIQSLYLLIDRQTNL